MSASRRIVVTGGSGFVGTNVVEYHVSRGEDVLNLDPVAPRNPRHTAFWQKVDPLDEDVLAARLSAYQPTHVLHLGARTDLHGPSVAHYAYNTRGVEVALAAVRRAPSVERVIFASSRMVCRIGYQPRADDDYCPNTAYGESKVIGERIVRAAKLETPWLIVRPTSLWGPWFDVPYRDFFLAVAKGRYVHPRGARIPKSFGYIENTVEELNALLTAPEADVRGRTLYLADYPPLELGAWAELIRRELDAPGIRTLPRGVLRLAAYAGDVVEAATRRSAPLTSFRLANLLTPMVYDLAPIQQLVGELPVSIEEGVRRTVTWLRECGLV